MIGIVITIDVDDLERAIAFYSLGLGLRLERRLFDDTVAELLGASSPIHLSLKSAGTLPTALGPAPRDYGRHWTPVHLDFVVDDVERATHRAIAAGAGLEGDIQTFPWGRMANLSDPFGHGLCIIQLVGRGYGEMVSR
jgi:predicted enzyme related to lactoylglutathione lyase